ncbi:MULTISPECIES: hypothetical protein [Nocardiaceae]|uniref:hypothetical protein n=1 Tax=Nocardiaceae TaxID=85025 RepID=UPI0012D304D8|nr:MULTISPECIES: hypothetical protein [Rhodococcus]
MLQGEVVAAVGVIALIVDHTVVDEDITSSGVSAVLRIVFRHAIEGVRRLMKLLVVGFG